MKIALLHYSAPPVVGGVESVIGHHARLMADAGHAVTVIAGRGEQTDQRVRFVQVPWADSRHPAIASIKESLDRGIVPEQFQQHVAILAAQLQAVLSDADCLIAHNVCSLNKNLVLTAALKEISERSSSPRFILWHHDLAWTTPRYRSELHEGYPWSLLCEPWENAAQVTISEFRRQELAQLMNLPPQDVEVIPNGVDVARFLKLEKTTLGFVERLGLLHASPVLLLPVRITSRKNIELALHVLAELRRQAPRATLVVTGPLGPHNAANRQYFEKLLSLRNALGLEECAHFMAEHSEQFLPDEVVSDFYRLSDALLLTSVEEGFGIPVLEAGLAGMPIFCSDIPPLRDLGGPLVEYFSLEETPANIASQIWKHLSQSAVYAFRARVRSQYVWQQVYQQRIQPLLERVCEQ